MLFIHMSFHKEPVCAAMIIDGLVLGFTSVNVAELWKFCDVIMLLQKPNSESDIFKPTMAISGRKYNFLKIFSQELKIEN